MKTVLTALFFVCSPSLITSNVDSTTYVWICTGKSAYSYHCNRECKGLNRCNASIKKVSIEYAQSKGRSACKICY